MPAIYGLCGHMNPYCDLTDGAYIVMTPPLAYAMGERWVVKARFFLFACLTINFTLKCSTPDNN